VREAEDNLRKNTLILKPADPKAALNRKLLDIDECTYRFACGEPKVRSWHRRRGVVRLHPSLC
jgi:hypothetical protein